MKKIGIVILGVVLLIGCAKEYSFENPLEKGLSVTIGSNCYISKLIDFDTIAQKNVYIRQANWNTTGNYPIAINEIDSFIVQNTFSKSITLVGDTFRIDGNQYFLVDIANNYRVREFVGRQDPYVSSSPIMKYRYLYDPSNRLITKVTTNPGLQLIVAQTDYKYSSTDSANLIEVKTKIPINSITYYEAAITYNTVRQPKNFIYTFPEAKEIEPYVQLLNFGKRNRNEPTKITIENNDQLTGTLINTTVTELKKYSYSSDGYVLSVDMFGNYTPGLGLFDSRNKFTYFCR